jgi:hypothetical protein
MQSIPNYPIYGFNLTNQVYFNYTGGFVYEFEPLSTFDLTNPFVDLSQSETILAIHKAKDVYFSLFLMDHEGSDLEYTNQIADNHFVNGINVDILNSDTSIARQNYISGSFQDNFTLTSLDNFKLFGAYNKNFGIRVSISGVDSKVHTNNIYVLGNPLELNKVNVSDGIASYSNLDPIGYQKSSSTIQSGTSGYLTSVTNSALYLNNWILETTNFNTTLTSQINFARLTGESIIVDWGDNTQDLIFQQTGISSYSGAGVTRILTNINDVFLTGAISPTGINGYSYSFSKSHSYPTLGEVNTEKNINLYYSGSGSTGLEYISNFKQVIPYQLTDKGFNIGGLGSSGSIDFDVEFFNNPSYTNYNRLDIYASDSINFVKSNDNFIKTVPLYQNSKNYSFKIIDDPKIDYDKEYWFKLCPFSDLKGGFEWNVGPYILSKYFSPVPVFTSVLIGSITGSGVQIIDSIPRNDPFFTYEYTSQFKDKDYHYCAAKILLVDNSFGNDNSRTGISFAESNISDDHFIHYSVSNDDENIYLNAYIDYSQYGRDTVDTDIATYRIYKISV